MSCLVSILLPLYNESVEYATLAIDSLCNQTYTELEIVLLLDNPQNKRLLSLLKEYTQRDNRIVLYINEKNMGLPTTLNFGISVAHGEFIARMDGDDISMPQRIEKQLSYLLSHSCIDLLGTNAYIIDENGDTIGEYKKTSSDYSQKMMLKHCNCNMIHPTWLGKAELFRACLYREFFHCEDYDFMLRAYAAGYKFHNLSIPLLKYRVQQKSISRTFAYEQYINAELARKQYLKYNKDHLTSYPILPILSFDLKDKEKYNSTLSFLNDLREAWIQKRINAVFILIIKIAFRDNRPLKIRTKALLVYWILTIREKIINICTQSFFPFIKKNNQNV